MCICIYVCVRACNYTRINTHSSTYSYTCLWHPHHGWARVLYAYNYQMHIMFCNLVSWFCLQNILSTLCREVQFFLQLLCFPLYVSMEKRQLYRRRSGFLRLYSILFTTLRIAFHLDERLLDYLKQSDKTISD